MTARTVTVTFTVPDDEETGPVTDADFTAALDRAVNGEAFPSNVSFSVDPLTSCRHCGVDGEDTGGECPRCERNRDTGKYAPVIIVTVPSDDHAEPHVFMDWDHATIVTDGIEGAVAQEQSILDAAFARHLVEQEDGD